MVRATLAVLLVAGLAVSQQPAVQAEAGLQTGINQVQEGELEAAIITLGGVVNRLGGQEERAAELARAHIYLAAAYSGLGQDDKADAQFVKAWEANKSLTLDANEFPPSFIQAFERAKGAERQARAERKGSKKPLLILGGVATAGGVAAVVATRSGGEDAESCPDFNPSITLLHASPPSGSTMSWGAGQWPRLVFQLEASGARCDVSVLLWPLRGQAAEYDVCGSREVTIAGWELFRSEPEQSLPFTLTQISARVTCSSRLSAVPGGNEFRQTEAVFDLVYHWVE